MKKLELSIGKINFKKVIVVYLIVAIIAGILSAGFLGFTFKDKLAFIYRYNRVSDEIKDNKSGIDAAKPELTALADTSSDIADILILDNENKIRFSAKNSALAQAGSLELVGSSRENHFLSDKNNPNVYFRLIKSDDLRLLKDIVDNDDEAEKSYNDDYFYETNFNAKDVYLLSYIADKTSGDKIYFISDIQPVPNGEFYVKAVAALAMLFFMLYWVLLALWVYANAAKSKLNAVLWGIIVLFTNLAGLFIYLIYKQNNRTCYKCGAVQSKADIFCTNCGTKIGVTCDHCHSSIHEKDSYCKNCGSKIIKG